MEGNNYQYSGDACSSANVFSSESSKCIIIHYIIYSKYTNTYLRQILIIGGGDGGILREVLKHSSVERGGH